MAVKTKSLFSVLVTPGLTTGSYEFKTRHTHINPYHQSLNYSRIKLFSFKKIEKTMLISGIYGGLSVPFTNSAERISCRNSHRRLLSHSVHAHCRFLRKRNQYFESFFDGSETTSCMASSIPFSETAITSITFTIA